ncbi:MAG: putative manganese transporter [Anaerovoracaceae bacterium]|nr:putative manganese transporter [Anaerovoracaceae bacterium]
MTGVLLDATLDTLKLLPFLFLTYLLMEYLEDRAGGRFIHAIGEAGHLGPAVGALLGAVPQCGFSAAAANLFSGGVVSVGTLLAVFLSTSDEMLPIFISEQVPAGTIVKIMISKIVIALICGFAVDFLIHRFRSVRPEKHIHDLCERDNCGCEESGIARSALVHTMKIALFIYLISIAIAAVIHYIGTGALETWLTDSVVLGVIITGIVGLIPNCAVSVAVTELYLKGIITTGQMMSGLLVSAGVGLLVMYRTNRNTKENLRVTGALLLAGIAFGFLIDFLGITF